MGLVPSEVRKPPLPPGRPPAYPWAANFIRSESDDTTNGSPVATSTSIDCPRPPRNRPGPPESRRSSLRRTMRGEVVSITSTGVVAMPEGKLVVDRPSFVGLAPVPPAAKNTVMKRSDPAPRTVVSQMLPAPSARTRSGMIGAKAPNTA